MPNKYPKTAYEPAYSLKEDEEKGKGYMLPRRNTIKVVSGNNLTLALKTDGTVEGSYNANNSDSYKVETGVNAGKTMKISEILSKIVCGNNNFKHSSASNASSTQASFIASAFKDDYDWNCVGNWRMISDVAVGAMHAVGLKLDGTVVSTGNNDEGQCDTSSWTDIVAVAAGYYHTVGLKKDGTVVATGLNENLQCDVDVWNYSEDDSQEIKDSKRIVKIDANNLYSLALRNDGTVVATSGSGFGENNVGTWTDIVDISAGNAIAVGLKRDGTVVVAGNNIENFINVTKDWKNVIQIAAGSDYILAIDYNGNLLHAGSNVKKSAESNYDYNNYGAVYCYNAADKKVDGVVSNLNFSNGDKMMDIFGYFDNMKFSYVAAGTCQFIAVTQDNIPYTAIHNLAFDKNYDKSFPIVAAYNLNAGPTFINDCPSGKYNRDLTITLTNTTAGYYQTFTKYAGTTPTTDKGTKYTSPFEMTNDRLTVVTLTEKDDEEQALVCYYYNFEDPEITAVPAPGVQTSTEVDVTLASSIKSHDIYYTTDGTEPPATLTNATTTAQLYTGLISIDKSTYIKARTYTKDGKASSSVFTMLYSIPTEATEGSAGTTVTYRQIAKGENKLWTAKDSPYIINSNLTVASGGTLEIEPGVTVKLGTNVSINVSGSLNAVGSEDKTIRFLGSSADRWGGLTLNPTTFGTDSVSLENAEIGGSSSGVVVSAEKQRFNTDLNGLYIHDNREGLKFSTKSAKGFAINNSRFVSNDIGLSLVSPENTVTGCEFNKNATAISVTAADNVITNSTVTNSTKTGILNKDSSGTKVNDCVIKGNTKSVEATSANSADYVLDFTNNDWGNITEGIIRNRIVDKSTKTEYPTVDITGYKADLSGFVPKCEFDTVLDADRTSNTLTLSNAATAKTVKLTAAKLETTYSDNIFFAVAMYDETGALVRVGTATQGLPDSSSDIVNLTMTETIPNADISRIAKIKVFAMSPTQLTPFAGTVIIE